RWLVSKRRVWPLGVVVSPPGFDDDLGLGEAVEDLTVKQFVAELRVEALAVAVLPRASWFDERCLCADGYDPLPYSLGDELRAVVGTDMAGHTTQDEQVRQGVDDVGRVELAIDADCKAFPGELVDDVEHAESPAIVGPTLDEVIGPDMVRVLGSKPDARSVIQPEPPLLRLLVGNLQPLPPPDSFDTLGVHPPALGPQHRRDPAIAITAIPGSKPDDISRQRILIGSAMRLLALGRAVLAENLAGKALRHGELRHDMVDAPPATGGAQKFPEAASFRISFSSVRSDTALRSRSFSCSSSFSRFTWSPFRPPNSLRQR